MTGRANNGFHNPDFPGRVPAAYGPTGTYRDALTARDELRRLIADDDAVATILRSFRRGNPHDTPEHVVEAYEGGLVLAWRDAVEATPMWIGDDVARGLDVSADTVPEPKSRDRFKLPRSGLALTRCPIFDRVMNNDGTLTVLNTAGVALSGFMWSRWRSNDDSLVIVVTPILSSNAMTPPVRLSNIGRAYPILPAVPVCSAADPGRSPFQRVVVRPSIDIRQYVSWGHSSLHWLRMYSALEYWCDTIVEDEVRPVREFVRGGRKKRKQKRPSKVGEVRVINLRRSATARHDPPDQQSSTGRTYSHRWIVGGATGGFWRKYRVGPGRKDQVDRWISPYVAGPEDAPLVVKDAVFKVDR